MHVSTGRHRAQLIAACWPVQFYGNEKEVGLGIKDSGVPRDELFLASKVRGGGCIQNVSRCSETLQKLGLMIVSTQVWTDKIYEGREAVRAQVEQTLQDLGTGSVRAHESATNESAM